MRYEEQRKGLAYSKVRLLLAPLPSPMPPHPPPFSLQAHQQKAMPLTTAIATNLPPRPPPSSVVEPIQRSPVLSPKVADPRQQRSGSVHPSSSPQRLPTPPQLSPYQKTENGSQELPVSTRQFLGHILPFPSPPLPFMFFVLACEAVNRSRTLPGYAAYR